MGRHKSHLVWRHIERVSVKFLERYSTVIKREVHGENGVYALYRNGRLYYVGLAKNLRSRLDRHLNDRHQRKWNEFSLYLTPSADNLRELEALLLRIIQPRGDRVKGGLKGSENLERVFKRRMREIQDEEFDDFFPRGRAKKKGRERADHARHDLEGLLRNVNLPARLRARYKGEEYYARLNRNGTVRYNKRTYNSLSQAGNAVRKKSTNGWSFWQCQRGGNWVKLNRVRR